MRRILPISWSTLVRLSGSGPGGPQREKRSPRTNRTMSTSILTDCPLKRPRMSAWMEPASPSSHGRRPEKKANRKTAPPRRARPRWSTSGRTTPPTSGVSRFAISDRSPTRPRSKAPLARISLQDPLRQALSPSFKNRHQTSQHLVHDLVRNPFQLLSASRPEIERAGLVTADNASRFGSTSYERHGKTGGSGEVSSARDRENHRHFRHPVECLRGHDQDRPAAFLFVPH